MLSYADKQIISEKLAEIDDCIRDLQYNKTPQARRERLKLTLWRKNALKNLDKLKRQTY